MTGFINHDVSLHQRSAMARHCRWALRFRADTAASFGPMADFPASVPFNNPTARQGTEYVRSQVIPTGMAAWQVALMPLIHAANQQSEQNGGERKTPAASTAGVGPSHHDHGKNRRVQQFVPRTGYQPDRFRTGPTPPQSQRQHQHQQGGQASDRDPPPTGHPPLL